jgi:hypothetical protein
MTIVPIAMANRTNRILFPGFIGYDFDDLLCENNKNF